MTAPSPCRPPPRDPGSLARPARRRHLRDDAADDAAGGRPGAPTRSCRRSSSPPAAPRCAGLLAAVYLLLVRAPRPAARASRWRSRSAALGTVVGFPLFLALALRRGRRDACRGGHRRAAAGHRGGRGARLPPAALGRLLGLRRARLRAWCSASPPGRAAARWSLADGCCCSARSLSAAIGYVAGARLSATMPAEQVICWVLVLSLPLTLPADAAVAGRRSRCSAARLGRLRLRHAVLDVARLLRLVPRPGARRHGARQPGAAAAAVPVAAVRGAGARRAARRGDAAASRWR